MVIVIYYGKSTTGHVALSLTGLDKQLNIHISIYPPNKSVPKIRLHSVEHDGYEEVTDLFVLPSEESCGYGLSEQAIQNWWKDEFDPNNYHAYSLFGRNCASAVWAALEVGQKKSASLNNEAITYDTYTISFPSNIARYTKKLIEHIRMKCPAFNELHLKYAELKECCRDTARITPYDQAVRAYSRLMQFNAFQDYCLAINKPFCDGIKKTLLHFKTSIANTDDVDVKYFFHTITIAKDDGQRDSNTIDRLVDVSSLPDGDIESHFDKLKALGNFIYLFLVQKEKDLMPLLHQAIKKELLATLFQYIEKIELSSIKEKERLKETFAVLKDSIDDQKNPHAPHMSKVEDMIRAILGLS